MLLTAKNVSSQGRAKNTTLVVYSCAGSKNHSIFTAFHSLQSSLFRSWPCFQLNMTHISRKTTISLREAFQALQRQVNCFRNSTKMTTFHHFEQLPHLKGHSATVAQLSRPSFRCYLILHILHWFSTLTCLSSIWDNNGWLDNV